MRIQKFIPEDVIRVQITKIKEKACYISLVDCTATEVMDMIKKAILKKKISPFAKGNSVRIVVREALGGANGKSKSISFRGMTADAVHKLILAEIEALEGKS